MNTVREFLQRLSSVLDQAPSDAKLAARHRRVVVPEAGRFSLDGTIVRTQPFEPSVPLSHPGSPSEVVQLLEWLDVAMGGSIDGRENDLGVDLAAILALATGRRVAFANEFPFVLEGANWTGFLEAGHLVDGELFGPVQGDAKGRFVTIVRAIAGIPENQALALGSAIRMRNAACCLIENDHSSAYGLLVVALETLSRAFGNPSDRWDNWDQARDWDTLFNGIRLSEQQIEVLRERLLGNKQIRLRRTFVEYASGTLSPSFWDEPYYRYTPGIEVTTDGARRIEGTWKEAGLLSGVVPQDISELRRRLGKSYDARSEVFHQSARLDQMRILPVPWGTDQAISFAGLRRILDHLLWREVNKGVEDTPDLPDVVLIHPASSSSDGETRPVHNGNPQ